MKKLTSKQAQGFIWSYNRSNYATIWQAYERPSYAKEKAYCAIVSNLTAAERVTVRIIGRNSSFFTLAYWSGPAARDYYDKPTFIVHTYANCYEFQ